MHEEDEKFEFFYISYSNIISNGCMIIRQHRTHPGVDNPDGMNIANAHKYLLEAFKAPLVILAYHKTTWKRKDEFDRFANGFNSQEASKGEVKSHLSVASTNSEPEKSDKVAELKMVQDEPVDRTT